MCVRKTTRAAKQYMLRRRWYGPRNENFSLWTKLEQKFSPDARSMSFEVLSLSISRVHGMWHANMYVYIWTYLSEDIGCHFGIVFGVCCVVCGTVDDVRPTQGRRMKTAEGKERKPMKKSIRKSNYHDLSFVSILQNFLDRLQSMPASETMRKFRTSHSPKLIESILSNNQTDQPASRQPVTAVTSHVHTDENRSCWESGAGAMNDERCPMPDAANTHLWCN